MRHLVNGGRVRYVAAMENDWDFETRRRFLRLADRAATPKLRERAFALIEEFDHFFPEGKQKWEAWTPSQR